MNILPCWITFNKDLQSVCVYKQIQISNNVSAKIDICGLGYYELYINGKKVSDDLLTPVWSDYNERDYSTLLYPSNDQTSHRIYYNTYDISDFLSAGNNTVCVMVGNGWYRQNVRNIEGNNWFSEILTLAFDITLTENGKETHIYSDDTCVYSDSYIKFNNVYFGEKQDFSEFSPDMVKSVPEKTYPCIMNERPTSPLMAQDCPSDKVIRKPKAVLVSKNGDKSIYTVNETVTGHVVLKAFGEDIKVTYADALNEDGTLNYHFTGGDKQIQFDEYIAPGMGQILFPHFTWHGFTYFEISGKHEVVNVNVVHSDCRQIVKFNCSNDNLNWLFDAYIRTQLDNMHGGVPSDCPHRERLGYTGDGQLTAELAMLTLETEKFYEKWIGDILDCQDVKSGHVQHTAPFYGGGGGPGGWGCAIAVVPYMHFKRFKNSSVIATAFPHIERWIDSMKTFTENGLIVKEYKDGWCLGDWCTPKSVAIPNPLVNTYYYIKSLGYTVEMAKILGKDPSAFEKLKVESEKAFRKAFYNENDGSFADSIQGADAFGYDLGLGDERTLALICKKYSELESFDTGIFGTDVLCKVLADTSNFELLFRLLSSEKKNTFAYMYKNGATTLWEHWDGRESRNHPMFGSPVKHLIRCFAGLDHDGENFVFKPEFVSGLDYATAEEDSDRGFGKISWRKDGNNYVIDAECNGKGKLILNGEVTLFTGKISLSI